MAAETDVVAGTSEVVLHGGWLECVRLKKSHIIIEEAEGRWAGGTNGRAEGRKGKLGPTTDI